MTNLEEIKEYIRQKCVEAQPNKEWEYTTECSCQSIEDIYVIVPIQLSDILLAIKKEIEKDNISHSNGYEAIVDLCYRDNYDSYNLSKPFTEQSEKTLLFIAKLLNYKEIKLGRK